MKQKFLPSAAVCFALVAGLVLAGGVLVSPAARSLSNTTDPIAKEIYERPGQLVRLPDRRLMNFRCLGQGSPTVVLESGFGVGSQGWGMTQPKIAAGARVCAYDRAGYGFSDPGPMPRDGAAIARDLDYGLKAAGISGPYVLVGHSAGGLYVRLFAARRRKDVVGLVFVDSSVEHQTERMQSIFGPGAGSLDGVERRPLRCLKATSAPQVATNDPALLDCAPLGADAHARQIALRPETWRTQVSELDNLFTTTSDEVDRTGKLLEQVPAIVLTAGKADGGMAGADDPGAKIWQGLHRQLTASFLNGEQRVVKSSHLMMNDRPAIVAAAALELVDGARRPPATSHRP